MTSSSQKNHDFAQSHGVKNPTVHGGDASMEAEFSQEPVLSYGSNRKLNRKAVLFLSALILGGAAMFAWGWSQFSFFGKPAAPQPKTEVVEVPSDPEPVTAVADAETLPPLPPLPSQTTAEDALPVLPENADVSSLEEDPTSRRQNGGNLVLSEGESAPPTSVFKVETGSVSQLSQTDYLLTRGTYIRCVLETRIVSDLPGLASCIVTEPVYSMNGSRILIPKGSKVSGQYKLESLESGRVGVVWERVLTADGLDIALVSPGVDGLGASGHKGHIDRHWGSRITAAVLISMIGDAVQIASDHHVSDRSRTTTSISGITGTVVTQTNPYQSQTASTIQELARSALQNAANRQATVTINQGELINIYAARDIDFSTVLP